MPAASTILTVAELDRLLATFPWDAWTQKLHKILPPAFTAIAVDSGTRAADALDGAFDATDPFVTQHFTSYLGKRITQLDETTRDVVTTELHRALEDGIGDGLQALAGRLVDRTMDSAAFSPARALMIARTETANAYNTGAVAGYRQNGIEHVEVSDGDDDDECAEADGQIWTLAEALAEPTAHPNCVRSFSPVVEGDEDEDDDE